MSYTRESKIPSEISEPEIKLLRDGFSYPEISTVTGHRVKSISERNRLIYQIDIWEAFKRRIERDGIPNRLTISDGFGYWFSGFFDGEGTISIFTRPCTGNALYSEFRLSVRLMIRDDDANIITGIKDNLNVGNISRHRANGNINPAIAWTCERVQDLAEVIIPLFERYPLHTKKAQEFAIWKPIVMARYISTLGGYSNRKSIPQDERAAFYEALERIKEIRTYK